MPPPVLQPSQGPQPTSFQQRRMTLVRRDVSRPEGGPTPPVPGLSPGAGAAAIGAQQGLRETLPILGGMAGALIAPETLGLSVPLGIAAGEAVGRVLDTTLDIPSVDELPEELRPFGIAGQVLGGSPAPGMAPLAATGRSGIRFIDRILQSAQRRPGSFAATEALAAGGAAVGTGAASAVTGGNPLAEIGGGFAGAALNPAARLVQGGGLIADTVRRVRGSLSQSGTQNRATQELLRVLETFDEGADPAALARQLRELSAQAGDSRTTAQLIDNPAFQALEAELARRNPQFRRRAGESGESALSTIRHLIGELAATGDPNALREAAQLRQQYFDALIAGRLSMAEERAVEAASRISADSPAARAEIGRRTAQILDDALSNVRAVERELWSRIPQHARVSARGTIAEATRIAKEEMLQEERFPAIVDGFIRRISKRGAPSVGEMLKFRSFALDESRRLHAAGDFREARRIGLLAEAALEDLGGTQGVDEARNFSRTLNDVFTRSFVGQAQRTSGTGARRLPPELLVQRATAGPAEALDLRLSEIEQAVRLGSPEAADEMLSLQERTFRLMASKIVDQRTGQASAPMINRFLSDNAPLLDRFPEVRETLRSVEDANAFLARARESTKSATQQIRREAAFSQVAQAENPIREIGRVLAGNAPQQRFGQLARLARQHSDEAIQGMRSAVLQNAFDRAGGNSGQFSFTQFRSALLDAPRPGQPSAMNLMRANNVIDSDTASRLTRLLDEADRIEGVLRARPELESLLAQENMLMDFMLRTIGSRAATGAAAASGQSTGPGLIIANAGSRVARTVMDKIPTGRTQDLLIQAAENPSMMATLLERSPTVRGKIQIARRMNAWIFSLGLAEGEELEQSAAGAAQRAADLTQTEAFQQQGMIGRP